MSLSISHSSKIDKKLENLVLEMPEFTTLENRLKVFCPFEAVNMVDAEIRHSSFLAFMMDPYRPHGFGSRFLRLLVDNIVKTLSSNEVHVSRLELHVADFEVADVQREWNRVDVLVALADIKLVIAIELKIGASESDGQLIRYRQAVTEKWKAPEWKHLFLLLTPQNDKPTDKEWKPITYETVVETIDAFLRTEKTGVESARDMLSAYAAMMRREHMEDPELIEITAKLWKEHREALEYLMENQPDSTGGLGERLKDEAEKIGEYASNEKITLVPDKSSANYTRFYVHQWDHYSAMNTGVGWPNSIRLMLVELHTSKRGVYAKLILGPSSNGEIRSRIFEAVKHKIGRSVSLAPKWKTLFSEPLVKFNIDGEDFDPDKAFDDIRKKFKKFVEDKLSGVLDVICRALDDSNNQTLTKLSTN